MLSSDLSLKSRVVNLLPDIHHERWIGINEPVINCNSIFFLEPGYSLLDIYRNIHDISNDSHEIAGDLGVRWCSYIVSDDKNKVKLKSNSLINFHTHPSSQIFFSIPDWIAFAKSKAVISLIISKNNVSIYRKMQNSLLPKLLQIKNSIDESLPYNMYMLSFKRKLFHYLDIEEDVPELELAAALNVNVVIL